LGAFGFAAQVGFEMLDQDVDLLLTSLEVQE